MDKYQMRVALMIDGGSIRMTVSRADGDEPEQIGGFTAAPEIECWERVENDRVVGYFGDDGALVSEPVPGLQARYIAHGDDPARMTFPVE